MKRNFLIALCLFLLISACSGPEKAPTKPEGIRNDALDLGIPAIPPEWKVTTNQGTNLELTPAEEGNMGTLSISLAPEDLGTNLIEAIHVHEKEIKASPEGKYLGARELSGPMGTAFYSRGRFISDSGEAMEETSVFALHPRQQRIFRLCYRYPAGEDSSARVNQLLGLFGEIE